MWNTSIASSHQPTNFSSHFWRLFTLKRIGYTVAGTFAFAGAAVAVNSRTNTANPSVPTRAFTVQQAKTGPTDNTVPGNQVGAASSTVQSKFSVQANVSGSGTAASNVQVNVNGQNIPVPANGSVQRTVTSSDGSQTTSVSATNSTNSQSNAQNSSSTSFNLNVSSNSTTSGSTATP